MTLWAGRRYSLGDSAHSKSSDIEKMPSFLWYLSSTGMCGHLLVRNHPAQHGCDAMGPRTALASRSRYLPWMHVGIWLLALQVGQCEVRDPISSIHNKREERRIQSDRQRLSFAERPADRRKVIWEQLDLTNERFNGYFLWRRQSTTKADSSEWRSAFPFQLMWCRQSLGFTEPRSKANFAPKQILFGGAFVRCGESSIGGARTRSMAKFATCSAAIVASELTSAIRITPGMSHAG